MLHLRGGFHVDLAENHQIIIKEADKGSGMVIMDRERYLKEGLRQLSDRSTYHTLDHDPSPDLEKELVVLVNKVAQHSTLTPSMVDYAIPSSHKLARFYLLPKVHKVGVPGRPVVSCCGALTERLSEIVDFLVKPLIPNSVTSYLRDTKDFLQKVRSLDPLPPGACLVTLDVTNLYPSIPHEDGLEALAAFLAEQQVPPTQCRDICELAQFVLTKNVFVFDSQIYIQVAGTAIGTKMAPTYAIIFMHMFEKKALASALYSPFIWVRFIDDIWSVWLHGLDKLREFVYYLNSRHPRITFTWEASESSVNFLDVTTVLTGSSISTDLFIKPTDTHQYLHPTSCHPGHIKRAIPYSQALRILNICSNVQKAEEHLDKLVHNLVCRGHSKRKIQIQVNKAKRKFLNPQQPKEISTPQDTPKPQRIPLVLTYHPGLPNISAITRRYLPVLHLNQSMKLLCPDPPLIAFRRPPNLRQSLIRAQVPPLSTTKPAPFYLRALLQKGSQKRP